jgi:hypothetical protein
MRISIDISADWADRARQAMGDSGSNDDEHALLAEIVDLITAADDLTLADRLASMLNDGHSQREALAALGISEDEVMSEDPNLPFDDPHNSIVDLCNGTYVQRHGGCPVRDSHGRFVGHEGGSWHAHVCDSDS